MATETKQQEGIVIPRMDLRRASITLVGDSPLICHQWSRKAKEQMLGKMMKKAKQARAARDPEQDFRDSLYEYPGGGYGFPVVAFKSAFVDACSHVAGITKVLARGSLHIFGDLAKIEGDDPIMREDMVRVGMCTADIRFRGQFTKWKVSLAFEYNASVISEEQIAHLFNTAGFAIGVGEWRPQKDGSMGRFHVATDDDFTEVK